MLGFSQSFGRVEERDPGLTWRRWLVPAAGAALVLTLLVMFFVASNAARNRETALSRREHSYQVVALARNVEGTVARAEALLARYVISLNPQDGRLFADEWRKTATLIANLRRATRDNPVQRRNMVLLADAYDERGMVLNDIALRATYDQRLGALGRLYEAGKSARADRIHTVLEAAIDHEMTILQKRNAQFERLDARVAKIAESYSLLLVGLVAAALGALWIANSAFSERRYSRRLAEAEAQRVDHLERAVRLRTEELQRANGRLRTEMEERAQAEASLRQLHKMEAIGQLTGGIAHDFNNMLAVVTGGLELARRRVGDDADATRHIDNAMEGARRAASLTRRLLTFARAEQQTPETVGADNLVAGMRDLVDRTLGDQIKVVIEPQAQGWTFWGDRHQIENALLNLCVNARDAMDGRGVLTLSAGQARLARDEIEDCAGGEYVRLSVCDTGEGMTPEVIERAFEPFFTTKPVGKGTGLGLSQVFAYVRQCDGHVRILSEPGRGTEVQIFLPRDLREAAPAAGAAAEVDEQRRERCRIFVVEDDARVLRATLAALDELGHRHVSCSRPTEAAAMLAQHPDMELILTDVLMPEMTGPEMVARMRARGLELPVIFVTGFAGSDEEAGLLDGEFVLRKPYTLSQLQRAIAEAARAGHRRGVDAVLDSPGHSGDGPPFSA